LSVGLTDFPSTGCSLTVQATSSMSALRTFYKHFASEDLTLNVAAKRVPVTVIFGADEFRSEGEASHGRTHAVTGMRVDCRTARSKGLGCSNG
jgi:hypothetical protein